MDIGDLAFNRGETTEVTQKGIRAQWAYDKAGNLLGDGLRTYTWDAENRLLSVTVNTTKLTSMFAYDAFGRRITITDNGNIIRYLWCGEHICAARSTAGAITARYFTQGEINGTTKRYYAMDRLGSIRALMDNEGIPRGNAAYDAYGKTTITGETPTFAYAGMLYHKASGLYLAEYRIYNPDAGRWVSRDPIGEAGGTNVYAYVGDNPANVVVPMGLCGPDPDPCKTLSDKISGVRNELAKRADELRRDPRGLPESGPMSIAGHQQQFQNKQTQLRNLLKDYASQGCGGGGGTPSDAWDYATMPVPQKSSTSDSTFEDFLKRMSAITGLTGAALLVYLGISEGSRLFPPRNLIPVP